METTESNQRNRKLTMLSQIEKLNKKKNKIVLFHLSILICNYIVFLYLCYR